MQDPDDNSLLKKYAEENSEPAFAALVSRHINKVYSAALRHTRNPGQAEEITQAVFVILAKKAGRLDKQVVLSGWLYQTARLASVTFLRSEIRRSHREQEAHMQRILNGPAEEAWTQIAPLLDSAMAALNESDRHAVVLRFFDGKSMREVGTALGATEETAKKRVSRALEKLRNFFAKRGVHSTTAIIAGAISANSVQAAPAALAQSVTAAAIASGSAAGGSTLTLVKGALKVMAWTKVKTAIIGGLIMAAVATTGVIVHYHTHIDSRQRVVGDPGDYWSVSDLSNAGYGDPKSALKTTLFAMIRADAQGFLASCTPVLRLQKEQGMQGKSEAELSAEAKRQMANVTAFRINRITNVSADTVIFNLHLEGANQDHRLVFKQVDGQWKLAGT